MIFRYLTKDFFIDYADCPQILQKKNRPYAHILITLDDCLNFALPIRHGIKHKYAFFTDESKTCGLDYSKAVLITKNKYIDMTRHAIINGKEYTKIVKKEAFIKKKLKAYINLYKKAYENRDIHKNKTICSMSSLQYFHRELNIYEI